MTAGNFYINSERDYQRALKQASETVIEEVREALVNGEDFDDAWATAVDGRIEAWTMYYADRDGIIKWTNNTTEVEEHLGEEWAVKPPRWGGPPEYLSVSDVLKRIAYWAFRADLLEWLDTFHDDEIDALREYDEDDDDEPAVPKRSMRRRKQPKKNPKKTKTRRSRGADIVRSFLKD